MPDNNTSILKTIFSPWKFIFFLAVIVSSCNVSRVGFPKNKPFVFDNKIEIKDDKISKAEKGNLVSRLNTQLDDSSRVLIKDQYLFVHKRIKPPVYDSVYSAISSRNMEASLLHVGYYHSKVTFRADTSRRVRFIPSFRFKQSKFPFYKVVENRVVTTYFVYPGNPTLIDTMSYRLNKSDLQYLADSTIKDSYVNIGEPVSKGNIQADNGRLIDLFRNNGYYKITTDNLQMIGDTTIAALTTISNDPFENLRLLAEAQAKRNKPTIKLATILNPSADTTRLKKYYINNVYIFPDYSTLGENSKRPTILDSSKGFYIKHRKELFKYKFLLSQMAFKKGDVYKQDDYSRTINNFSKTGVWQSVNIQTLEVKDSTNKADSLGKLDMYVRLIPARKFGLEANIETSYSTNNNYSLGNLLGISGNLSVQNRNRKKEGVKTTTALHAGVEFNVGKNKSTSGVINSNDVSISRTVSNPKLVWFLNTPWFTKHFRLKDATSKQTFYNVSASYTNRIDLFNLQSAAFAAGYSWANKSNGTFVLKFNIEFSRLFNESETFKKTLIDYPYLKYSFNTALVSGPSFGYTSRFPLNFFSKKNKNVFYPAIFKANVEGSGLSPVKKYLRNFIKGDIDFSVKRSNTTKPYRETVLHFFAGMGIPFGKEYQTLPFFKQYYAGGANSMRGWPIRGIGQGILPLPPFDKNTFNDKTGDIKLEANLEYRHLITPIIPNSVILKGAVFIDFGNIWNFRNTKTDGTTDSSQFKLSNFYKQFGVAAGYGFRLDFNYFLIRFDFGFRLKKPDEKDWHIPNITFNNLFKRGEILTNGSNESYNDDRYKKWRYENFNFTVGIGVPFQ